MKWRDFVVMPIQLVEQYSRWRGQKRTSASGEGVAEQTESPSSRGCLGKQATW